MPVFHLEEQTFLKLRFPSWISNFKKQIVTAVIKTKLLWFRQNDLPEEKSAQPFVSRPLVTEMVHCWLQQLIKVGFFFYLRAWVSVTDISLHNLPILK